MGQNRPPTLSPGRDSRIIGNKSALEKGDAMFIDFTKSIKTGYESPFLFRPSKTRYYKTEEGRVNLRVDDYALEKIEYEISGDPLAADSVRTTFWKTKGNLYFLMFIGGLTGGESMFGPFRLKGDTFLFEGKP